MSESRKRKNTIIISAIFVYVFVYFALIFKLVPNYATVINGFFVLALTIAAYFMYGIQHCGLNKTRRKVIFEVLIALIVYFALIYLLGLSAGFMKNSYSLKLSSIVKNAFLPVLSMVALELFRYIFVSANKDNKETIIYMAVAAIMLDMVLNYYGVTGSKAAVFVYFTVKVLPIIFKNVVMTYLTYQVGFHPCVLYVIPLSLFKYILQSIPNLGNYLYSVIDISLPSMIYIFTSKAIRDELSGKESLWEYTKIYVFIIPITIFFSVVIGLVSGIFNYQLVGINTSDIYPQIKRGDAVLIYKNIKYEAYDEGDIIVFKNSNNELVIARIDLREKDENGNVTLYVITKMTQNNEVEDDYEYEYMTVTKDMMVGKYDKFKIGKIAYPSIWFNDFIKGDVHEN